MASNELATSRAASRCAQPRYRLPRVTAGAGGAGPERVILLSYSDPGAGTPVAIGALHLIKEQAMDNQTQTQTLTATPPATPSLNNHVSAEDLKKIRGGIASPDTSVVRSKVEKSDEDFPVRVA
jgi:hypothetical protein